MLNRGIGGRIRVRHRIGGYFDVGRTSTTKELFLRWAEWAALTPIFRLHGSVVAGTHAPWTFDAETVQIYRRLSRLHIAAAPLIAAPLGAGGAQRHADRAPALAGAAGRSPGRPRQDQEWLLGPNVLVAPVVTEGARSRSVYFPRGCWLAARVRTALSRGALRRVPAPLGRLPYFFRCGTRPFAGALPG